MKIILSIFVIMCITYIDADELSPEMQGDIERATTCRNQFGLSEEEVTTGLMNRYKDDKLSPEDCAFVCCNTRPMILKNNRLNFTAHIAYVKRHSQGVDFDVYDIIESCESDDIDTSDLHWCKDIAKFFTCVAIKAQEIVRNHYDMLKMVSEMHT